MVKNMLIRIIFKTIKCANIKLGANTFLSKQVLTATKT